MYKRIVVPLDGSEIAEAALVEAEAMARLVQAPIHLVRVVDVTSRDTGMLYGMVTDTAAVATLFAEEVDAVHEYLEQMAGRLSVDGRIVTTSAPRGNVVESLVHSVEPDDLIVMASHGRSGIARWFLGSVAEEVVRRSPVPVLLVRSNGKRPGTLETGKVREQNNTLTTAG